MKYSPIALFSIAHRYLRKLRPSAAIDTSMSNSGDSAIQQRAAAHMRSVRGAENPTAIPLGIKFRMFFRQADRHLLTDTGRDQLKAALQLSQADWELLTAAAQRNRSAMDAIELASQQRMQNVCQRVSVGNLEPAAIGRSLREADDQHEQALTQHLREMGQSIVCRRSAGVAVLCRQYCD